MKKIALLGLLSLCGASLFASHPLDNLLNDALADETKVQTFIDAVLADRLDVTKRLDIDTDWYGNRKKLHVQYLEESKVSTPALAKTVDRIFAALEAHRSEPVGADELRRLINNARRDEKELPALEAFLVGKSFNIDLIVLDPSSSTDTIGMVLDMNRSEEQVKNILHLPRIDEFRYKDTAEDRLKDFIRGTLVDARCFQAFDKLYTDMVARKLPVDIDKMRTRAGSARTMGYTLYNTLKSNPNNDGALLIAERVQADRTDKHATVQALFRGFKNDPVHLGYLTKWFKKFPVDIDTVEYKGAVMIGTKLKELVTSLDAPTQKAAIEFAEVVRPYRAVEMNEFRVLLAAYKNDKTPAALDKLKDWFKQSAFDIDSAALDPAQPNGETLGESINGLKDDALSAIFKDKRSKVPAAVGKSWLSPRNVLIAGGIALVTVYLWHKKQSNKLDSKDELPAIN